jgi:hypothetical protein
VGHLACGKDFELKLTILSLLDTSGLTRKRREFLVLPIAPRYSPVKTLGGIINEYTLVRRSRLMTM